MKNYIVSLSKRALLLSGALAIFTACDEAIWETSTKVIHPVNMCRM